MSRTKTPADIQAWAGATADAGTVSAQSGGGLQGFDPAALMDSCWANSTRVLSHNPAIDHETASISMASSPGAAGRGDTAATVAAQVPDRASWSETVQALQENGAIGGDEANELIRTFESSLQPLERRESRVALEFARRLTTDGEEKALAWFRSQATEASGGSKASSPVPQDPGAALRSEVVNSRSRRLRGPPRR